MPVYEYECDACGTFDRLRRFEQSGEPVECPRCGILSPRIFSLIHLRAMSLGNRLAHERNERSAHEPHVRGGGCSHGPAKSKPRAKAKSDKPPLQYSTRENSRPWMLGH